MLLPRHSQVFCFLSLLLLLLLLLLSLVLAEDDSQCLQNFHKSVTDPQGFLSNWNFANSSAPGYVCSFNGITCWNALENKVLALKISQAGISGGFPSALQSCLSIQTLDLSQNSFSGSLPPELCSQLPFLTSLDLSDNDFSGPLPDKFQNCTYLNTLQLQQNRFSGALPWEIGTLPRLTQLNLSSNYFSGAIPSSYANRSAINQSPFPPTAFEDNPGLCGVPLSKSCSSSSNRGLIIAVAVAASAVAVIAFICALILWFYYRRSEKHRRAILKDEHKWAKHIKAPKYTTVSLFERPLTKLKLSDLMAATNDFHQDNIIGSGRTGTMYRAFLPDGSMLAVKRLSPSPHTDKDFKSEMDILGKLRHRNLVPLLGFCLASPERLLVYKHMLNGSLKSLLFEVPDGSRPDWLTRLKIAIGAARGLAWLHHSCNPRIIHRNISSSSILLDDDYEPRITDFGLARLMNPVDTHISTFVNGDFGDVGFVPPEYTHSLVATLKGDTYSYGVVLLELATGRKANDVYAEDSFKGNLAEWIRFLSINGRVEEAIDRSLENRGFDSELCQFLKLGRSCVSVSPKERPTMYEVHSFLRNIGQKYNLTDDDDLLPMPSTEIDGESELIVARGN